MERQFLTLQGLPERRWFRHLLQAPGLYLGYASESFPGVMDAIDAGNMDDVSSQMELLSTSINNAADFLRGAPKQVPLSQTVILVVSFVGVAIVIFLAGLIRYFTWIKNKRITDTEENTILLNAKEKNDFN